MINVNIVVAFRGKKFMHCFNFVHQNCRHEENIAICTCFSIECASYNGNRPIRYCQTCHEQRHKTQRGQKHIYHLSIPEIWECSLEMQRYLVDAIIR